MTIFKVKVVIGAEDVGGNDRSVPEAMLIMVTFVHDVQHALSVAIALVGGMRRPVVDLLVGENDYYWV